VPEDMLDGGVDRQLSDALGLRFVAYGSAKQLMVVAQNLFHWLLNRLQEHTRQATMLHLRGTANSGEQTDDVNCIDKLEDISSALTGSFGMHRVEDDTDRSIPCESASSPSA
jgi:hypothetical protein